MEECHVFEDHKGKVHLFTELQALLKQKESLIKAINHLESDIEDDSKFAKFVIEACKSPDFKFGSACRSFRKFEELCLSFIHYNQKRQVKDGEKRSCFKELREISINAKRDQLAHVDSRIGQLKPITPRNPTVDDIAKLKREQRYLIKANSIKEKCFKTFKEAALAKVQTMGEDLKRSKDLKKIVLAFREFERCSVKLNLRLAYIARKIDELKNCSVKTVEKQATTTDDDLEESVDQLIEIDLRNLEYPKHSTDIEADEKASSVGDLADYETMTTSDYEAMTSKVRDMLDHEKTSDDSSDYEKASDDSLDYEKTSGDSSDYEKASGDSLDYELLPGAKELVDKELDEKEELDDKEDLEDSKLNDFRLFCPADDDLSSEGFNPDGLDPTTDHEEFLLFDSGDIQEAADYVAKHTLSY